MLCRVESLLETPQLPQSTMPALFFTVIIGRGRFGPYSGLKNTGAVYRESVWGSGSREQPER